MWVHCPRASNGLLPRRSNLVGYVRWDAQSDRFLLARQSFQQLSGRNPTCPSLAHNKLFRSSAHRGFPLDSDNCRPSPDLRWRTTKSAVGLDLSTLEVSAPFHDFPWMGEILLHNKNIVI